GGSTLKLGRWAGWRHRRRATGDRPFPLSVSCRAAADVIYVNRSVFRPLAASSMHLTLIESDRSFLRSAECAFLSIVAHAGLAWFAAGVTAGGRQLPTDERDARVFF